MTWAYGDCYNLIFPRVPRGFPKALPSRRWTDCVAHQLADEKPLDWRALGVAFFVSSACQGKGILPWPCQDS